MCPIINVKKFACRHTIDVSDEREICLFGEHCETIKHSHPIFQNLDEDCPDCRFLEKGGIITVPRKFRRKPQTVKPNTISNDMKTTINKTCQAELRALMLEDLSGAECKSYEHYIFHLPEYVSRGPLVDIFGKGVAGYYGKNRVQQFIDIAAKRGFSDRMKVALQKGHELRDAEKKAQEQLEEDNKHKFI
ncbi:hypothetical protein F5B20DRAFT_520335 [Whalleya microplaca]|nr:hypothetical protein F5B20DRAFT_520335 [Whalleya microplaca]